MNEMAGKNQPVPMQLGEALSWAERCRSDSPLPHTATKSRLAFGPRFTRDWSKVRFLARPSEKSVAYLTVSPPSLYLGNLGGQPGHRCADARFDRPLSVIDPRERNTASAAAIERGRLEIAAESPARSGSRACDGRLRMVHGKSESRHTVAVDQTVCCSLSTRVATGRLPTRTTRCLHGCAINSSSAAAVELQQMTPYVSPPITHVTPKGKFILQVSCDEGLKVKDSAGQWLKPLAVGRCPIDLDVDHATARAYTANVKGDAKEGISEIDISDPTTPKFLQHIDSGGANPTRVRLIHGGGIVAATDKGIFNGDARSGLRPSGVEGPVVAMIGDAWEGQFVTAIVQSPPVPPSFAGKVSPGSLVSRTRRRRPRLPATRSISSISAATI